MLILPKSKSYSINYKQIEDRVPRNVNKYFVFLEFLKLKLKLKLFHHMITELFNILNSLITGFFSYFFFNFINIYGKKNHYRYISYIIVFINKKNSIYFFHSIWRRHRYRASQPPTLKYIILPISIYFLRTRL